MFLVDKESRTVLAIGSSEHPVTGEWADWIKAGRAVWSDSKGLEFDEVSVATDGTVSANQAKIEAKQIEKDKAEAKKNKLQALKARLKSHDASAIPTLAAMKPVMADVLDMLNELLQ